MSVPQYSLISRQAPQPGSERADDSSLRLTHGAANAIGAFVGVVGFSDPRSGQIYQSSVRFEFNLDIQFSW